MTLVSDVLKPLQRLYIDRDPKPLVPLEDDGVDADPLIPVSSQAHAQEMDLGLAPRENVIMPRVFNPARSVRISPKADLTVQGAGE